MDDRVIGREQTKPQSPPTEDEAPELEPLGFHDEAYLTEKSLYRSSSLRSRLAVQRVTCEERVWRAIESAAWARNVLNVLVWQKALRKRKAARRG